ncbi:HIR complex subunit, partial [Coemansia sp. RSA 2671]
QLRLEQLAEPAAADRDSRIAQIMDACLLPAAPAAEPPMAAEAPVPVMTKSGKKRVAPVFVRPLGGHAAQPSPAIGQAQPLGAGSSTAATAPPAASVERVAVDAPVWIEARALGTRALAAESDGGAAGAAIAATVQPLGRQTLVHAQSISAARVHLSVPRVVAHVTCTATATRAVLAAYNQAAASTVVSTAEDGSVMWTKHMTGSAVALLAASDAVAAASCSDGSLHVFDSASGARLLPPIVGEAHLAHLRCVGRFCLALDCVGQLTVWDVDRLSAVVDHVSVAPLLYSAELAADHQTGGEDAVRAPKRHKATVALTAADVAPDTGAPIVCLSDGRAFAYHLQLRSWLCIGDPTAYAGSEFAPRPPLAHGGGVGRVAFTPTVATPLGRIQETG